MVSYSLSLDIEPPLEGDAAGYVQIAGKMMRAGTTNHTKAEIDETIDFIGATLSTSSKGIFARSLTRHSDELLGLMSDILFNPAFPQEELDKIIKQETTGIQGAKDDPGYIASNIAGMLLYGKDDPYGEIETEQTLANVTIDKCRNYYNTYFRPNVAYLVIVGDITPKEAKSQARKYFGSWKEASVPMNYHQYPLGYNEPKVVIANKEGANQSTIEVTHTLMLPPGNPDEIKASLMNQVLGGGSFNARLFQNLREDKAFTYGAYSNLDSDERVGSFSASAKVRTSVTDSAIHEILIEMNRMRTELVSDEDLALVKNVLIGSFSRSLEDPQTIARFARNIAQYNLPKNYYETYLGKVEAVTPQEIQTMAEKYLHPDNAIILAVGNADEIREKMVAFSPSGSVTQYDYYGNIVEKKAAAENVTPQEIVANYLKAIGGTQALQSVKDIETVSAMTVQGMPLEIISAQKAPNKICVETIMQGNTVSKQIFDGEKGKVISPMGEQELQGEMLQYMQESALLFPELTYATRKVKMEIMGVETIDGKDLYKLKITSPSGKNSTLFFGVKDGLKYKEVVDSPQGSVSSLYNNYKKVEGILLPMTMKQTMGPQSFDIEVKSVKVNEGIDDSRFAL
jgi:predicted Zn-dependent peptidase/outer membrane lipoprotein-sorting protein